MAEEKSGKGWIKAGITSVFGLLGGAVLMYVSPLVNSAIKPPKPVPNFAQQAQGLTVTFLNRSTGGGDGWWDFGDGSALEPFNAKQESIIHGFPRPGTYTVKLSLRNFLGDESERSVSVNIDANAGPPVIEEFAVRKTDSPLTFRIVSRVKNADLTLTSLGDTRPVEINADSPTQDRTVSYDVPGNYKIRLVAVNGKQSVEKIEDVRVGAADVSGPMAVLQVTYKAVHAKKMEREMNVCTTFPHDRKENTYPFKLEQAVDQGFQILEAKLKDSTLKSAKLEISSDKTKFIVSGELTKPSGFWNKNAPPPSFHATVAVTMERRSAMESKKCGDIMAPLKIGDTVVMPWPTLDGGWQSQSHQVTLDIKDGGKVVLRESKLPCVATVQLKNRPCRITATQQSGQVRIEVIDLSKTLGPPGN